MEKPVQIYINKEISWLRFNACVLQEAAEPQVPLIERLRFLGIFSNNLDEFYKVRYAAIRRAALLKNKNHNNIIQDQTAEELLTEIKTAVNDQMEEYENLYHIILNELERKNIFILNEHQLSTPQKSFICEFFQEKLSHTIITYILNDLNQFPELKDGTFYFIVEMWRAQKRLRYALLEVLIGTFSRFVLLPSANEKQYVIFLEDIIRYHLKEIFSIFRFNSIEAYAIKITRDAELSLDNDLSKGFLEKVARSVEKRKRGTPVRLVYDKNMLYDTLNYLKEKMELDRYDNMSSAGKYHNRRDFMEFPNLGRTDLEYEKLYPSTPPGVDQVKSYFTSIDAKDQLLYTPYHNFSTLIKFLREAAIDPRVKTIKMTIYRVADDSRLMKALINAARNGKEVVALIELRARFDEAQNIYWAKKLQSYDVRIISGVPGLKVHAKLCQIERFSKGQLKRYAVIGTGNFNEQTAKVYTDFVLFTADKRITDEVVTIFDFFDANYKNFHYTHLMTAPNQMRAKINSLIDQEIENVQKGLPAYINLKVNNLCDKELIDRLYQAGQSGVKIRIQARSICSLIPQIPNWSENIWAITLVDKFLEHARLYWFAHGGQDLVYISSADWMPRNLDFRVEAACPIYDLDLKKMITDIFEIYFQDNIKTRLWPNIDKKTSAKSDVLPLRAQTEIRHYLENTFTHKDQ
ncbi:MAG: polyphosphate kinase 1 [Flavobacteriales bacterium AspAUS03]